MTKRSLDISRTKPATITIGAASIPLDSYVISGTALLGTRDAGKTWTGKTIAEQLLDHGVPLIVFDPIGRWQYMRRSSPTAKRARGYKIVVAGGERPDLPLTPRSAPELVRAAIRENIPLIIDLYDTNLSKRDWRDIVRESARVLLMENRGLRHVFIEEAAEFVPQSINDGETYAAVEKLVRMGGNVSLGVTLINQRAQEVNKAVLELCDNLVLMKQRGARAIEALEKWIDKLEPDLAQRVAGEMPRMTQGEAWVFSGDGEHPVRTRSNELRSFHPDRRKPELERQAGAAADTATFVSRMTGVLEKVIAESKAADPETLKKQVRELEAQVKRLCGAAPAAAAARAASSSTSAELRNLQRLAAAAAKQAEKGLAVASSNQRALLAHIDALNAVLVERTRVLQLTAAALEPLLTGLTRKGNQPPRPPKLAEIPMLAAVSASAADPGPERAPFAQVDRPPSGAPAAIVDRSTPGEIKQLGKGAAKVLAAIAQYGDAGVEREQLFVLTGYKDTSIDTYITRLRSAGLIDNNWPVRATDEGIQTLGPDFTPLPTGNALQEHWLGRLGEGGEKKVLVALLEAYPNGLSKQVIGELANYRETSVDTYVTRLRARRVIEKRGSEWFVSGQLFGQ